MMVVYVDAKHIIPANEAIMSGNERKKWKDGYVRG
jgi:hypothetical protein